MLGTLVSILMYNCFIIPEHACAVDKVAENGYETEKGTGIVGEEKQTGSSG